MTVAALAAVSIFIASSVIASSAGAEPSASEQDVATMVNDFRARNGKPPLRLDPGMSSDARAWSDHMARSGLAHDPNFARSCERFPGYTACSENVGSGTGDAASVQAAMEASASHRANLLCDCTHLGVGVTVSGGRTYLTERFVNAGQTASPSTAPAPQYSQAQVDEAKRFVTAAYADFLGRSPSEADLQHWEQRAVTASQRQQFVHAIAFSAEALGGIIDTYYEGALGRPADAAGRQYWTDQIRRGVAPADVVVRFYASEENFEMAKRDLGRWVDGLYGAFFGRRADDAGRAHWAAVAARHGRSAVARSLHDSTESVRRRIDGAYAHLLGRAVDAGGMQHWSGVLRWTRNDVRLAETLASSTEYRNRALQRY